MTWIHNVIRMCWECRTATYDETHCNTPTESIGWTDRVSTKEKTNEDL